MIIYLLPTQQNLMKLNPYALFSYGVLKITLIHYREALEIAQSTYKAKDFYLEDA